MLKDIRKNRIQKLKNIRELGLNPYPSFAARTRTILEAINQFQNLSEKRKTIGLVGRIRAIREHGGSVFVDIKDGTGLIQVYFKKDILGEKKFRFFQENFDIGDFVAFKGVLFKTKRGEKTLEVKNYNILAKSLLPLPEKWHGLQDIEERYRKRYIDLIFNKEVKEKFVLGSRILENVRLLLKDEGFLEVETPMLQVIPGGALARPFKTRLNALNLNLYLRIAPELYLKRLLVGGFEKIYEIGRVFRNEGMDRSHNPEFTILELYWAYKDYKFLMKFVEKLFRDLLQNLFRKTKIEYEDKTIDFKHSWPQIEYDKLLDKYAGLDIYKIRISQLKEKIKSLDIKIGKSATKWEVADEIYKKICQPKLVNPTFVINHPIEVSLLAKRLESDPREAARFQLVAGGLEIVNGFSELNDPQDQLERFREQEQQRRAGAEETQRMDKDFIEALEYGMPPAAGLGIGIDRLVMLLTNSHSLREVILFPTMRPKKR